MFLFVAWLSKLQFIKSSIVNRSCLSKHKTLFKERNIKGRNDLVSKAVSRNLKFDLPFHIHNLILRCGDIETNPGPIDTKSGKLKVWYKYITIMLYTLYYCGHTV